MSDLKDVITFSISIFAFVLSAAATVISLIRSKYEKQRAIRHELTDVLSSIISVGMENAKLYREASQDPAYYQAASSSLNQRNTFLLQQAIYLVEQIPKLATAVEYNTIAYANANSGDVILAEKYYLKAIARAQGNYYTSLATRSYANFLFQQRRFEEGREQYKAAITMLKGSDNLVRYTNGLTYQMWAWNEQHNAHSPARAIPLFESAETEFKGIDNESVRQNALMALQMAKGQQQPQPAN